MDYIQTSKHIWTKDHKQAGNELLKCSLNQAKLNTASTPSPPWPHPHTHIFTLSFSYRTKIQEVAEFLICFDRHSVALLLVHAPLSLKSPARESFIWRKQNENNNVCYWFASSMQTRQL